MGGLRVWAGIRRWAYLTWASYRGIAPLVLLVVALGLGYVGYREYFADAGEPRPWYDLFYFDLQLLTFNTRSASDPSAPLPWALQIARFMAPLVAGYGAVVGILRLFRDRFDQSRARFSRRHAVVVGASPTGLAFVRSLRADGRKVVLVEEDASNPIAEACRELGALVLQADARHPESLVQAGLGAADHLVAVSGDDGTNVEVVVNAHRIRRRMGQPLRCLAHVVDPDLWQLLRANELTSDAASVMRIDCFNLYEHGARAMLADHPPPARSVERPTKVLVVGDGPLAARLVVQLARRSRRATPEPRRFDTALVGPSATALRAELLADAPGLEDEGCVHAVDAALMRSGVEATAIGEPDIAYVCVDADRTAVVVAQRLRTTFPATPIVVSLTSSEGIVGLLEQRYLAGPPGLRLLAPFALLDRTCRPESLLVGAKEGVAEALHDRYREQELAAGMAPTDPRVARWADLSPDRQESCRSQAASIGDMIRLIGCDLIPHRGAISFAFTESEVARLARFEHDRWRREREAQGWSFGPERDDVRKRTPLLVPWDRLPDEARATTRRMILSLPDLVEEAGYQIVRLHASGPASPWIEPVAQAIHERYLARRAEDGQGAAESALAWEDLGDALKDSNRAQAADISTKLASIGCWIVPASGPSQFDGFTSTELDELSRQEHDRWVDERRAAGWRLGPRDRRASPDLVGWEELDEARRELDREAVRAIPEVLAAAGMAIERRAPT